METVSTLKFPDLFVSAGQKKLKFEKGTWFSVLHHAFWGKTPQNRNHHLHSHAFCSVQPRKQTHAQTWVLWHTCSKNIHGWMDIKADTRTDLVILHTYTRTLPPPFYSKWFICSDLGEMIPCNETDRGDDFFIHLGTKRAVALFFMVDSLCKHCQWVLSFPITPTQPLIISDPGSARSDRQSI